MFYSITQEGKSLSANLSHFFKIYSNFGLQDLVFLFPDKKSNQNILAKFIMRLWARLAASKS